MSPLPKAGVVGAVTATVMIVISTIFQLARPKSAK